MTEEERFSTIKITKKTKNADLSPTYAPLRDGGASRQKKIKKGHRSSSKQTVSPLLANRIVLY
jgi:hypothetical protein